MFPINDVATSLRQKKKDIETEPLASTDRPPFFEDQQIFVGPRFVFATFVFSNSATRVVGSPAIFDGKRKKQTNNSDGEICHCGGFEANGLNDFPRVLPIHSNDRPMPVLLKYRRYNLPVGAFAGIGEIGVGRRSAVFSPQRADGPAAV